MSNICKKEQGSSVVDRIRAKSSTFICISYITDLETFLNYCKYASNI